VCSLLTEVPDEFMLDAATLDVLLTMLLELATVLNEKFTVLLDDSK
jgi:hypothetical protein